MELLDGVSARDILMDAVASDLDKSDVEDLFERILERGCTFVESTEEPQLTTDITRERLEAMYADAVVQVPQQLEDGTLELQTWCMDRLYTAPSQSYGSGEIEVVQVANELPYSPRNIGLRYAAYLYTLITDNDGIFSGDNFLVEGEERVFGLYLVTCPTNKRTFRIVSDTPDDIRARTLSAMADDGLTGDADALIVVPLSEVKEMRFVDVE